MSTPIGSSQWMYASGEAVTQQSLKFNDDESQYLSWTPAAAGNRKTMTLSVWAKRGNLGGERIIFTTDAAANDTSRLQIRFGGGNDLRLAGQSTLYLATSALFRDVSSWYHIVLAINTTEATASDRLKLWVNGEQITAFSSTSYPSQNSDLPWNLAQLHGIGSDAGGIGSSYFDGYLSDIHFIDGQALDASSFGETVDGYWKAKDYAGTYGTNGFHLTFQDDVVSEGFNTVTYRGTGASQSVSGLGLEADLVWVKARNTSSYGNKLYDSVRGFAQELTVDATDGEYNLPGRVTGNSDGFDLGTYAGVNGSGNSYVAWAWDAGSGSPVSNTDGSITSTVKANPSYGFSIVSYTGTGANATVGHGIATPDMIIVKARSFGPSAWSVYTATTGAGNELLLNTTAASAAAANVWNNTAPTSSVFTVGTAASTNQNTATYIAYCFHSVAGYSSIGSYSGSGAAGNTITTGFEPAFVMIKATSISGEAWWMFDNTRSTTDPRTKHLRANTSGAENTSASEALDFTSTGFEHQGSADGLNKSGTTYIYMAFADTREAAFWKDVSGQGNHWTPNNLDYRDSLIDSPANNFATLNSLRKRGTVTYSEGNLQSLLGAAANTSAVGSFAVTSGKWYFEARIAATTGNVLSIGVEQSATAEASISAFSSTAVSYYGNNGNKYVSGTASAYGASYTSGDVVGVAFDLDSVTQTIEFFKNGTSQGSINLPLGSDWQPILTNGTGTGTQTFVTNFGQDSTFSGARPAGGNQDDNGIGDFAYAPPSGYLALCTANLPTPTIIDGSEHFDTVLYSGTGATQSITGVGFQPDWVWFKRRSASENHWLTDVVRGSTKGLYSNLTDAEATRTDQLTSFDADGFSLGADAAGYTNISGNTYAAWNWKAGGTAVSNTDGSITSQVSANTDAGFSIVSYTGTGANATVGHSLGVQPSMIIAKRRDTAENWPVYTAFTGSSQYAYLDFTNAFSSATSVWQGVDPTSSVFSIGTSLTVNSSGGTYIAYCFANIDGYSKVGSFIGNGSTDGPFVYTGFRPAFVLAKDASVSGQEWTIYDAKRDPSNVVLKLLSPTNSGAEATAPPTYDFLSNGFKLRSSDVRENRSGSTFIYLAFAENPFKYANAR